MGLPEFLYSKVLPIFLVGSLFRRDFPSLFYLLAFVVSFVFPANHPALHKRAFLAKLLMIFMAGISLSLILVQAIVRPILSNTSPLPFFSNDTSMLLASFGFKNYDQSNNVMLVFFALIPDIVIFLLSSYLAYKMNKNEVFRSPSANWEAPDSPTISTHIIIPFVFLTSVCYASLFHSVFFLYFFAALCFHVAGKTVWEINYKFDPGLFVVTIMYLFLLYLNQIPYLSFLLKESDWFRKLVLTKNYEDISGTNVWPFIAECSSLLMLFLLLSYKRKITNITREADFHDHPTERSRLISGIPAIDTTLNKISTIPLFETVPNGVVYIKKKVPRFVRFWGWPICLLLLLVVCLMNVSILSFILLLLTALGSISSAQNLLKYKILQLTTVWLSFLLLSQYAFNVFEYFSQYCDTCKGEGCSVMKNIGFLCLKEDFPLTIGVQSVTLIMLSFYWRFRLDEEEHIHEHEHDYSILTETYTSPLEAKKINSTTHGEESENEDFSHSLLYDPKFHSRESSTKLLIRTNEFEDDEVSPDAAGDNAEPEDTPLPRLGAPETAAVVDQSGKDPVKEDTSTNPKPRVRTRRKTTTEIIEEAITDLWNHRNTKKVRAVAWACGQFFLTESYKFSLVCLYFAALKDVNLFNAGYMLFFIIFAVSEHLARFSWILLVIYCESIICLIYIWQMSWTRPIEDINKPLFVSIGLIHIDEGSNLFTMFYWHFFILFFVVIQWQFNKYELGKNQDKSPPFFVWAFLTDLWHNYGIWVCYIFLVSFALALIPTNFIYVVYLIAVAVCCVIHMQVKEDPKAIIRYIWLFVVFFSGTTLIAKYAFQFPYYIKEIVDDKFNGAPIHNYFELYEFGLENFRKNITSPGESTALVGGLAPNTWIFILAVYQFVSLCQVPRADPLIKLITHSPLLYEIVAFLQRFLILYSPAITNYVILAVALSSITPINYIFIILLLCTFTFGTNKIGTLLMIYSWVVVIAQLLYQFDAVPKLFPDDPEQTYPTLRDFLDASGLSRASGRASMWQHVAIIIFLLIQRFASWWSVLPALPLTSLPLTSFSFPHIPSSPSTPITLFRYPSLYYNSTKKDRLFWVLSHGLEVHAVALWILSILMGIYVRQVHLMGLVYGLVLGLISIVLDKIPKAFLYGFSIFMSIVILWEYTLESEMVHFLFGWTDAGWDFPCTDSIQSWCSWLLIGRDNSFVDSSTTIFVDYLILTTTMYYAYSQSAFINLDITYYKHLIHCNYKFHHVYHPGVPPKKLSWYSIRFGIVQYSAFWILLFVFGMGTIWTGVISVGYLAFSLYFLSKQDGLLRQRNKSWKWAQYYNFGILLLRLIYQVPYVEIPEVNGVSISDIMGLQKVSTSVVNSQIVFIDLFIFALLAYQKRLFELKDFDIVNQIRAKYRLDAIQLALQRHGDFKKMLKEKNDRIKREQEARKRKLEAIQESRKSQAGKYFGYSIIFEYTQTRPKELEKDRERELRRANKKLKREARRQKLLEARKVVPDTKELKRESHEPQDPPAPQPLDDNSDSLLIDTQTPHPLPSPDPLLLEAPPALPITEKSDEPAKIPEKSEEPPEESCWCGILDELIVYLDAHVFDGLADKTSRADQLLYGFYGLFVRNSHLLVYFVILVNTLYYHNIVSLVYPISLFAFAIMETPRPNKPFWRFLFLYTTFIICLKFIIFIPGIVVCDTLVGYSNFNTFTFSWPYSFSVKNCPPVHGNGLRLAQLIGIDYNSADNKADRSFVFTVLADLMILLMLNLNQLSLKQAGLWDFVDAREHDLYNFEEEEPVEEEVEPLIEKKQRAITKLTKTLQSVPTNEEPKEDQNVPLEEESLNDMDLKFQSDPEDFVVLKKGKLQAQSSEELLSLYKSEEETPKSAEETTIASLPPKENSVYDIEEYHPSISSQSTPKKTILEQIEIFGKETVANIDKYYKDIFNEKKNGADYYAGIFGVDVLSFMLLAFFPTEFISESSNLVEFLNENSLLPTAFVVILLGQFGMIVIERMIYLFQAIRIKLILLYIYILFYHFAIFVYIPMQQRKQMSELPATVIFYLLKLTYFFLTGLQIRNGYPKLVTGRSFQSDEEPGYVSMICFVLYRIIPFLYELRTLLDWAITPTTLTSYEWLKFEDIYAELFLVKCRICLERMWERKSGDYQPAYYKILTGGGLFLLFVFVLWSPLIIFTQGTNIGGTNPVTQGSISFGITGYKSLYDAEDIQCLLLSEDYFSSILNVINDEIIVLFNYEDRKSAVESKLSESSFSVWTISPPLKTKLIHDLKNNTELFFTVTMAFYRNQPDRTKSIIWKNNPRKISAPESTVLYAILTNTTNQLNDTFKNYTYDANSVILRDFFPRAYRLPITGTIKPSPKTVDVILSLNTMIDEIQVNNTTQYSKSEYWSIQQIRQPPFFNESEVELIVVSQPFVNWIPESIVVAGIISVYSVFVLGLGRFLRIYVSGLSHRAIFEDMPEVDELLEYCTDILLARQDGVPELEEELFRELVEIYRSPERMIRMTLPRATRFKDMSKEKID